MRDLVERQKAIEAMSESLKRVFPEHRQIAEKCLNALPSVTPKQKRGKWETVEDWDGDEHYQCSECGAEFVLIDGTPEDNDYYFCPHCGARMTKEDV